MSEFDEDLAAARSALYAARDALRLRVAALDDAGLDRARRGGWSVRQVIEHVVASDVAYARVVAHLRGSEMRIEDASAVRSAASAMRALDSARGALLGAIDGVTEDEFYALRRVGHEQYSVLSVIENAAAHDEEHLGQIGRILEE